MNYATFSRQKKKGRPYLYVREIARVNGKPEVVSQTYIGSPDRVADLVKGQSQGITALKADVMDDMKHLHSILTLPKSARKPTRRLETPSKTQAEVLSAFGYHVNEGGGLQPTN